MDEKEFFFVSLQRDTEGGKITANCGVTILGIYFPWYTITAMKLGLVFETELRYYRTVSSQHITFQA